MASEGTVKLKNDNYYIDNLYLNTEVRVPLLFRARCRFAYTHGCIKDDHQYDLLLDILTDFCLKYLGFLILLTGRDAVSLTNNLSSSFFCCLKFTSSNLQLIHARM